MSKTFRDMNVSGGRNVININPPTQRELELESASETITIRTKPTEKKYLEQLAEKRNQSLSPMLKRIIFKYLKIEPQLHEVQNTLDDIL